MFLALIAAIPLHLAAAGAALPATGTNDRTDTQKHSLQHVSAYDSPNFDSQAERGLLEKANTDRERAGLSPLRMDDTLVRAAREHAAEMAAHGKIAHQFPGEAAPSERIVAVSTLHLSRVGENVAVAESVEEAHSALMASPPHRD